jgi:hypothetical protein
MKSLACVFAIVAGAILSGCASTPKATEPAPVPDYADGRQRPYIAVREFVLYAAPRPESPQMGRVMKGEQIEAAFSLYAAPWNQLTLSDGRRTFVFGNPIYPVDAR